VNEDGENPWVTLPGVVALHQMAVNKQLRKMSADLP